MLRAQSPIRRMTCAIDLDIGQPPFLVLPAATSGCAKLTDRVSHWRAIGNAVCACRRRILPAGQQVSPRQLRQRSGGKTFFTNPLSPTVDALILNRAVTKIENDISVLANGLTLPHDTNTARVCANLELEIMSRDADWQA